jgi:hypothetical protein
MNRYTAAFRMAIVSSFVFRFGIWVQGMERAMAASEDFVTVRPEETDELLANPGIGWETFHTTRTADKNLPNWIPSTVQYARWGWGILEPRPGQIDYEFLDKALEESCAASQRLAFRVMCCSTTPRRPYHPGWLQEVGGKVLNVDYENQNGLAVPDLDDPIVLERHLDFLKRLGARYDGHPGIDHIDLGTVGWWGEWHMSGSKAGRMPTVENRKKIIDAYVTAFKKTRLLMLIGDRECLTYAAGQCTGWRADCLGDMGGFSKNWSHMRIAYPQLVKEAGVQDLWKTAPIAWETCWDIRRWVKDQWSLRYIFNYALAVHGSYINNKSAPIPEGTEVRSEIERFLRRLGYRLVLREIRYPKQAQCGQVLQLEMKWQNIGSAPCYTPYRLAYKLTDDQEHHWFLTGDITVDKWLPGSVEIFTEEFLANPPDLPPGNTVAVSDRIVLLDDMQAGEYQLAIGVVGEDPTKPVVKLGIKGRSQDGWYLLSELTVVK